jgi:hypothetical protein
MWSGEMSNDKTGQGSRMPLGEFRGGSPLERIVAYSDRWAMVSNLRIVSDPKITTQNYYPFDSC